MKPQPCHHKDFGCVRFLVSDQGALPAPPTRPISRTFPLQESESGSLWGHGAISGSWERLGEQPQKVLSNLSISKPPAALLT